MLHLQPIPEKKAPKEIQVLYEDIKQTMSVDIVPLLFQYLANFPIYFAHMWERIKQNITHTTFANLAHDVQNFSLEAVEEIYFPSNTMKSFLTSLAPTDRKRLGETTTDLLRINTHLLIVILGIRESVKGVFLGVQKISEEGKYTSPSYTIPEEKAQETRLQQPVYESIAISSSMLAPLFGTQSLEVTHIPQFFALIDQEVKKLQSTEHYLAKRVGLEYTTLTVVNQLPLPVGTSYKEFMELTQNKPYLGELLYLLFETFPSSFPRLLLTTALMQKALT